MNIFDYLFLIFLILTTIFIAAYTTVPPFKTWLGNKTAKIIFWTGIALTCIFNFLGSAFNLHW